MFANNIVGTANATTAGWGNLGGGVTQMLMVAVYAGMRNAGYGQEDGWRLSFLVPACITGTIALGLITISDDTPRAEPASVGSEELPPRQAVENDEKRENSLPCAQEKLLPRCCVRL